MKKLPVYTFLERKQGACLKRWRDNDTRDNDSLCEKDFSKIAFNY